jgi:hypothetical protein
MFYSVIFKGLTDADIQTIGKRFNPPVLAKIGAKLDSQETRDVFNSLTAINNEVLVIDLDAADEGALIDSLHAYRIQRTDTRIIVYAPGRNPGNVVMSQLVAMGIYDIIAPEEAGDDCLVEIISEALEGQPATYAVASRYANAGVRLHAWSADRKPATKTRVETRVIEKFIETQRPIGLITIAIAGTFAGAGCTHTALGVSHYIFRLGHKVILAKRPSEDESNEYNSIVHIHDGRDTDIDGCASVHGIDIVFKPIRDMSDIFSRTQGRGYEYLVLDMGCLDAFSRAEMSRSEIPILVASASSWRLPALATPVQYNNEETRNWTVAVNTPSKSNLEYFRKTFQEHFSRIEELPFFPDPFGLDENLSGNFSRLLSPVLPGQTRQRKGSWLPWKR